MLTIQVLGPGCTNCRKLEGIARAAVAAAGVEAQVVKVTDMQQIVDYGVLKTPGLVIDEKLVCSGRIPSAENVAEWIAAALGR